MKTVSGMMGHYSAGFTLDTYAHVTKDTQIQAVNTVSGILTQRGTDSNGRSSLKFHRPVA